MVEKVISQIKFEISQIDELFDAYSSIVEKTSKKEPDLMELTVLASVVHSFYNGMENLFLCIAKRIDHNVPAGDRWHRDLLNQMGIAKPERNQVLSQGLLEKLIDYLGFRHFYRHSYSFTIQWEELEKLIIPIETLWNQVKQELEIFLVSVEKC